MSWYKCAIAQVNENVEELGVDNVPTYCMKCKGHMDGIKAGFDHPAVLYMLCEECKVQILKDSK